MRARQQSNLPSWVHSVRRQFGQFLRFRYLFGFVCVGTIAALVLSSFALGPAWTVIISTAGILVAVALQALFLSRQLQRVQHRTLLEGSPVLPQEHFEQLLRAFDATRGRIEITQDKLTARVEEALAVQQKELTARVKGAVTNEYEQFEELLALYHEVQGGFALPALRNWTAAPDFQRLLYRLTRELQPSTIIECGSGTTTLVAALALGHNGQGRVIALEHLPEYAATIREQLAAANVTQFADVWETPLVQRKVLHDTFLWYEIDPNDLPEAALLVVDGPPGNLQKHSRYPAVPLLASRLEKDAVILLDDLGRTDEREIVQRWQQEFPHLTLEALPQKKGTALLRWDSGASHSPNSPSSGAT